MPTPAHTAKADKFHALSKELIKKYNDAIEGDINDLAKRTGRDVDLTFVHNDLTRILVTEIPHGVLAGMCAEAILQMIQGKVNGNRR